MERTCIPTEEEIREIEAFKKALAENNTDQLATFEEHEAREMSGKLVIRIPKILHLELKQEAEKNGVSLNQYILYKLTR